MHEHATAVDAERRLVRRRSESADVGVAQLGAAHALELGVDAKDRCVPQ